MTIINLHTQREDSPPPKTVLCLGNFDGVHIGHQKLIKKTVEIKKKIFKSDNEITSGVWFFCRSPLEIISGIKVPSIINQAEKLRLFRGFGLDYAFIFDFEEIGNFSPEKFISDVLKKQCNCVYAVCGYNFKFGKDAAGDSNTLKSLMNGNAEIISKVSVDDTPVSSTNIRNYISDGNVEAANKMLGRNYSVSGNVIHGKELGRTIGIPTINMHIDRNHTVLKSGVYVSKVIIDTVEYQSVSNIGTRPSVDNDDIINCETHIIDYNGDLYGRILSVEFFKRIRDEKKFPSICDLKSQILRDVEFTKKYFINKEEA